MRTNLFLSTLFAVSLVGGAALAEKPHDGSQKEPRAVEALRAHGDTVDKNYRGAERAPSAAGSASSTSVRVSQPKTAFDKGASRVNCSEAGDDCAAQHAPGASHAGGAEATASGAGYARQAPAFLDKILGSDRTNFNEAGEDEGMSSRAVKRAWSHAGPGAAGSASDAAAVGRALQRQNVRTDEQASSARMSCNDADECSMSVKAMRKEWAQASIKAGTWAGPAREPTSNAARRIAEQRAEEGKASAPRSGEQHGAAQAQAHAAEQDHQH